MNKKIGIILLSLFFIFSLFVPCTVADVAPSLSEGLVLYLPFDEGSGTTAIDYSGLNNHGTYTAVTWNNGKYNLATVYDGSTSYLTTFPSISLTEFTFSFWVNISSLANRTIIANSDQFYYDFDSGNNQFVTKFNASYTYSTFSTLTTDTWILLTVVYNGTHIIAFKNGVATDTQISLGTVSAISGLITGAYNTTPLF